MCINCRKEELTQELIEKLQERSNMQTTASYLSMQIEEIKEELEIVNHIIDEEENEDMEEHMEFEKNSFVVRDFKKFMEERENPPKASGDENE
jgi:hypothetical protein